jgi:glutamate dehydrogenase
MLKILDRDYGDRVRVVGMADGTGCAEDPNGLPMGELLRLFERGEPLSALNRETMGHTGVLTLADTPTGAAWRNSMHNRVVADAFVPAGGRPATINATNWEDFLQEDGTPSAKVVVEGANLFLTADARLALFERCSLPIVKDSSANKCGVICSSLEIVASMTLSSDEFVDLKTTYVNQTLERLRDLARQEAQLLFDESKANLDTPLPALSERISLAILRASQALGGQLDEMHEDQQGRLWPLVREQLPPCLFERHASRLPERVPWEYQSAMISSGLASRLVYREGLSFCESLSDARLPSFALRYLQQEQVVKDLARQVESDGAPYASKVKGLLLRGGVRAATETPLPSLASIADNLSPKPSQPSI